MTQCFCGCGQKVRFGGRSVNKRGKIINLDVAEIRGLLARGLKSPNAEAFVHDGDLMCAALADAVHAGVDPGPELQTESRGFMAFARKNFGRGVLGSAVKRSGMSPEEAANAMASGEWDPYADVEIPR